MPPRAYTRVAVAQLDCLPAVAFPDRAPFEDPLFDLARPDSLLPQGTPPPELDSRFRALRERIARSHFHQLLLKVQAILSACQQWGVRILVFPEYSLPWQVLEDVARSSGDLVVIAGTHMVTRPAVRSGLYERLGGTKPNFGEAVCPVLHRGRLLGLQPKLSPAKLEQGVLKPGQKWAPISLPDGLPGPMGVLICLDFLHREGEAHRKLVSQALAESRFLAVPSYTPYHSEPEFSAKAEEEAKRYKRPVLWADVAMFSEKLKAGGSSIYVDEGHSGDLRRFPEHPGYLEPGDEGVIVADVDLGFERVGDSTRYDWERPVVPFASASLVYRHHPANERYAQWLGEAAPLLSRDDDDAVEALAERITADRILLLDAGSLSKARETRLRRLVREMDHILSVEQIRRFTREVVLPPEALPLSALRAALAGGASDAIFDWQKEWSGFGLGALREKLHEAGRSVAMPDPTQWTEAGREALRAVHRAVVGEAAKQEPSPAPAVEVQRVVPSGVDPAALGELRSGGFVFRFRPRPEDFRTVSRDELPLSEGKKRRGRRVSRPDVSEGDGRAQGQATPGAISASRDLFLLTVAEASGRTAAVAVGAEGQPASTILAMTAEPWMLHVWDTDTWWAEHGGKVQKALEQEGLRPLQVQVVSVSRLPERLEALLPRFKGSQERIKQLRAGRLESVNDTFVEPTVRVGEQDKGALAALDEWLASPNQTALLLGDYGSGKSTTLAEWCFRLWDRSDAPRPLLCSLASATATRDAEGLLLDAAGTQDKLVEDSPSNRAALQLLIRAGRLLPVFDGFDEMATRLGSDGLAGRLSELIGVAARGGRIVVSSREHYFESEDTLSSTTAAALRQALGSSAGLTRLTVRPFKKLQVEELVQGVLQSEQRVEEALKRIRDTYDLTDLVTRPLLLGMVLKSLDRIEPTARVAPADIYEAYLEHWLSQTRQLEEESLSHEQKKEFAEALAEKLWRSGAASCSWQELHETVRERLGRKLPRKLTPEAAFLGIQGGAFFVREDGEHYRFAHKSFLEYFLARALEATLTAQPRQTLDTRPLTQEVAAFLGELLRRKGNPLESPTVQTLQALLRTGQSSAAGDNGDSTVVANALRLLHGLATWAQDKARWIPEGADLRGFHLIGEDLRGAQLGGVQLSGAILSGADLSGADLTGADLSGAVLTGARLDNVSLRGATAAGADFRQTEAMRCNATGAKLARSMLSQSVWLDCQWEGVDLSGADVTATVAAPAPRFESLDITSLRALLKTGHQGRVRSVAFALDGRTLASAGDDGRVLLWDSLSGQLRLALSGHKRLVLFVVFAPDGRTLASAGGDGRVILWDSLSGQQRLALSGHQGRVRSVAFAPDGRTLASAGEDGRVLLWDFLSGQQRLALSGHQDEVNSVAFAPDGRTLASAGDDGRVLLWDALSGQQHLALSGHRRLVLSVAFAPDGRTLASAGSDGRVILWDSLSGQQRFALSGHQGLVWSVAFASDGRTLASTDSDGHVLLWDSLSGQQRLALSGRQGPVLSVAFTPDGRALASAGSDGRVLLWDSLSGQQRLALSGHQNEVNSVAFAPDGRTLASAGDGGRVLLWDSLSGQQRLALSGHQGRVRSVAFAPDGRTLASAGEDGRVLLWDSLSGQQRLALSGHQNGVNSVAFAPDGRTLASAGDNGRVLLWDALSGQQRLALSGKQDRVLSVAFAPDGCTLASAGVDGRVRLWDALSGQQRLALSGHRDWVRSVAFAPDGRTLASAGDDGSIRIWDAKTGRKLRTLSGHSGISLSVTFSPDGQRIVSAGEDGVYVWSAKAEQLLGRLMATHSSSLTYTPNGYCVISGNVAYLRLAVHRPEQLGTLLYLPLGGLRSILERPDKVRAALSGQPDESSDRAAELAARGWAGGKPWDGQVHRLPEAATVAPAPAPRAAPLPSSPFRAGSQIENPETLAGRESTALELLTLVNGRSPAVVLGPRRAGKTWLLEHMKWRLGADHTVRDDSLQGKPLRSADDLARLLEPEIASECPSKSSPSAWVLQELGKQSRSKKKKAPRRVYLLDEVACLQQGDETLFPWLRALGQKHGSVVLAGSNWDWVRVVRHAAQVCPGSSFGNDITPLVLGPISEADARRFLTETSSGLISETLAGWVVELCGAWPFYLQVMGHALYLASEAGNRKPFNDKRALAELYDQRLLFERKAVFEDRLKELPDRVRELLFAHPDERPEFFELTPKDRVQLVDTGLCDTAGIWLSDRPFFDWIRQQARVLAAQGA